MRNSVCLHWNTMLEYKNCIYNIYIYIKVLQKLALLYRESHWKPIGKYVINVLKILIFDFLCLCGFKFGHHIELSLLYSLTYLSLI
jgi:hypothetical protein